MPDALAAKSCIPCRGDLPALRPADAEALRAEIPAWSLVDGATRIERRYAFEDFQAAFRFVSGASDIAEAEGHHPDITFGWGYASVSLFTHKIKGLHENDFVMAAKYDALFASSPGRRT